MNTRINFIKKNSFRSYFVLVNLDKNNSIDEFKRIHQTETLLAYVYKQLLIHFELVKNTTIKQAPIILGLGYSNPSVLRINKYAYYMHIRIQLKYFNFK